MKKKMVTICLVVALVLTAVAGGSLAYFTDKDAADNVFTAGNVQIDLNENFDAETAQLIPGKDINKDVWVKNTGKNDAYVRVHIAIPTALDDGDPTFNASNNFLHWNFTMDSVADGKWSWIPTYTEGVGYKGNGAGNWNFYSTEIGEEAYNVYVATYRSIVAPNAETEFAMDKVYMDATVDATVDANGMVTYKDTKGNEVKMAEDAELTIKVVAEAAQAEGFANAYEALNTAFGIPGTYNPFVAE